MSFDYSNSRLKAEAIISKFGAAGSVVKKGVTGGLDEWGDAIANAPDIVITGIITPAIDAKLQSSGESSIDGTNILMGDRFCFFHSETAPEIGMQATLNSVTYGIVNIKKLDSVGGVNVFRKLQLRV